MSNNESPEPVSEILGSAMIEPVISRAGFGAMSPVAAALAPKIDLSNRPRRKMHVEQPVCARDLSEAAGVLVELLAQNSKGDGLATEALRYARHIAAVLMKAKHEEIAENAALADSLARASLEKQKEIPLSIVSGGRVGERVTIPPLGAPQVPLDGSIDGQRWATAYIEDEGGPSLTSYFSRAIGAGIAAGRVREREVMIEEMRPVFRNLEILDMWADKMNVKGGERGLALHQDPDARRWAREFLETVEGIETREGKKICDPAIFDEGWLISWFANAMMASYDWAMKQRDRLDSLKAHQRNAHVYGPLLFTTVVQSANAPLFDSSTTRTEKGETFHGLAIRIQPWKREHGQPAPQLAVVVAWKQSPGPGLFARWRGKMRMAYGFCPCCNSDAPELDRCEVCLGYSTNAGCEFPPSPARKAAWRKRWLEGKGIATLQGDGDCGMAASDSSPSIVAEKSDTPEGTCISSASNEVEKSNVPEEEEDLRS